MPLTRVKGCARLTGEALPLKLFGVNYFAQESFEFSTFPLWCPGAESNGRPPAFQTGTLHQAELPKQTLNAGGVLSIILLSSPYYTPAVRTPNCIGLFENLVWTRTRISTQWLQRWDSNPQQQVHETCMISNFTTLQQTLLLILYIYNTNLSSGNFWLPPRDSNSHRAG